MVNHRLRGAMLNAELTATALAALVEVDVKSVHRWITEDRVPYPTTRLKVAHAVQQEETLLWPTLLDGREACATGAAQVDRIWPTRSAIPSEIWHALFSKATDRLDILVYAGAFLLETLDLADILRWKASAGTKVRVLVGDPRADAVQARAAELSIAWLPDRCRSTMRYLEQVASTPGIDVRLHGTTHYASLFRFDDILLANTHAFGSWSCHSPVLQLRRSAQGTVFDFYDRSFDRAWGTSIPPPPRATTVTTARRDTKKGSNPEHTTATRWGFDIFEPTDQQK